MSASDNPTSSAAPFFELGRYSYTLEEVADEATNYPLEECTEDIDVERAILEFSPAEVRRMIELAMSDIGEIDDDNGVDETTLLCRAALEIVEARYQEQTPG